MRFKTFHIHKDTSGSNTVKQGDVCYCKKKKKIQWRQREEDSWRAGIFPSFAHAGIGISALWHIDMSVLLCPTDLQGLPFFFFSCVSPFTGNCISFVPQTAKLCRCWIKQWWKQKVCKAVLKPLTIMVGKAKPSDTQKIWLRDSFVIVTFEI